MWKYTAVIIEPRKHKALEFVLRNFIENLSDEWKILIFHGRQNKEFIQEIIYYVSNNTSFTRLADENLLSKFAKYLSGKPGRNFYLPVYL